MRLIENALRAENEEFISPEDVDDNLFTRVERLRDLEGSAAYTDLVIFLAKKVHDLEGRLTMMRLTPENMPEASRLQGQIVAYSSLFPQRGDLDKRTDVLGEMLYECAQAKRNDKAP